ncbi:hypothetical protein CJ030_MR5G023978 [Morella rubra]|uniref:Uncharacterized protein n=1 Tax=Morella rubra TaxID=262757 RepID=A0A6A1VKQ8_9ROSI|nr:hypothetical protein CJ030_MR5G023978 [Morella rubra]
MSQGTPACPSSCASTSASKRGRGRTRGVSLEKSLGSGNYRCISRRESVEECLPLLPPIDEDWNVGPRADSISVNKWADVPTEVKEYIMDECWTTSTLTTPVRRTSSRVKRRLLKPHPDTTEEQWKELCDLFTSEAFMKRSEQNKKNRSKLTVNHAAGSRSFQRTRACMERMDAFQRQCDLEGKTYTEIELAKARDERAAREKDLQEFAKKQAEMEATLRDHREEQRVEQERIRLEQEERMKRSKSACEWSTRSACNWNKSACERSKSAYEQKYQRNWRRKCPL